MTATSPLGNKPHMPGYRTRRYIQTLGAIESCAIRSQKFVEGTRFSTLILLPGFFRKAAQLFRSARQPVSLGRFVL